MIIDLSVPTSILNLIFKNSYKIRFLDGAVTILSSDLLELTHISIKIGHILNFDTISNLLMDLSQNIISAHNLIKKNVHLILICLSNFRTKFMFLEFERAILYICLSFQNLGLSFEDCSLIIHDACLIGSNSILLRCYSICNDTNPNSHSKSEYSKDYLKLISNQRWVIVHKIIFKDFLPLLQSLQE